MQSSGGTTTAAGSRRRATSPPTRFAVTTRITPRSGRAHSAPRDNRINVSAIGQIKYGDRKSTRLNSSHVRISYAVFCLKKKKKEYTLCMHTICTCVMYTQTNILNG